uniref:Uncharacterized protein n=1 Tax=Cajanus cajan TaxID=3821 RepID=A0A151RC22_CAJCA|nr:hypothetical protein KK1_038616 [Cajanus cajan]
MSSETSIFGDGRRRSNSSYNVMIRVDADWSDDRISLGCFPTKISSVTTPKLKTSHFSFTTIV